ncbi:hypothetical protein EKO04_011542 [Ascochyta lentis]|uniref:Secreted protein n=1 Tax=Ascochyta lentis TaxID=205686 RepID=A0A8H7ITJ0_9PLEO|nr:hypothetical protein EKO04_011542 [Ascochyta lentis]
MQFSSLLFSCALTMVYVTAQIAPAVSPIGVAASSFNIDEVSLISSRFMDNQNRTLSYLKSVDLDRLLYVFRSTHKLSTNGATPNGGWDAPEFPFRSHVQGHFLTAWAQCYAQLKDTSCRDRATTFVAELLKCQNNNAAAGFSAGYVSGFPESEFTKLGGGTLSNGNVPYYAIHKTLAGLLDVLSSDQMQKILQTEFGGMNEVMADIYHQTGNKQWLTVAQRFDHTAVFNPLASNQDVLDGLHANTQVPKWIGAAREYKATGTARYADIARNAWAMTVGAHTYCRRLKHIQYAEADPRARCHGSVQYYVFRLLRTGPDQPCAGPAEFIDGSWPYHYFTSLSPGGKRGVGPAWGGGTWSTDYDTHWCCQGTGLETNTKMQDSIYFHDDSTLFVNLFLPSVLNWQAKSTTIRQTTTFPAGDTTTLTVSGSDTWTMKIRIPFWTKNASISVNDVIQTIAASPGSYATLSRSWKSGDVTIKLPMSLHIVPSNDNKSIGALAYSPSILSGNYGTTTLSEPEA